MFGSLLRFDTVYDCGLMLIFLYCVWLWVDADILTLWMTVGWCWYFDTVYDCRLMLIFWHCVWLGWCWYFDTVYDCGLMLKFQMNMMHSCSLQSYVVPKPRRLSSQDKQPLTLTLRTWRIWWAPNNASKWQIGFNSAFKGLNTSFSSLYRFFSIQHTTCSRHCKYEPSESFIGSVSYMVIFSKIIGFIKMKLHSTSLVNVCILNTQIEVLTEVISVVFKETYTIISSLIFQQTS
jgi:hypothetical protein